MSTAETVLRNPAGKRSLRKRPKDINLGDRIFSGSLRALGVTLAFLLFFIAYFLWDGAQPAFRQFGFDFITTSTWDPVREVYGALPVIFGTVVSSLIGIAIAAPMSIGIGLFLTELAPARLATVVGFLIQMLAAIPSVVYGLWGIFVLAPGIRLFVGPALERTLGTIPVVGSLFQGPMYGVGMMTAGIILAIMVIPTISSICTEVFRAVPITQREAALGLGCTRWEMMKIAVIKASRAGIFGAVILGLGRALGETMAVTMVIGNRAEIAASFFAPAQTMASVIANEYAEAMTDLHHSSLAAIGVVLFAITVIVNMVARAIVWRVTRKSREAR